MYLQIAQSLISLMKHPVEDAMQRSANGFGSCWFLRKMLKPGTKLGVLAASCPSALPSTLWHCHLKRTKAPTLLDHRIRSKSTHHAAGKKAPTLQWQRVLTAKVVDAPVADASRNSWTLMQMGASLTRLSSKGGILLCPETFWLVTLWKTNIIMGNHHFYWVNQLFLWPLSIANCKRLPEASSPEVIIPTPVTSMISVCGLEHLLWTERRYGQQRIRLRIGTSWNQHKYDLIWSKWTDRMHKTI